MNLIKSIIEGALILCVGQGLGQSFTETNKLQLDSLNDIIKNPLSESTCVAGSYLMMVEMLHLTRPDSAVYMRDQFKVLVDTLLKINQEPDVLQELLTSLAQAQCWVGNTYRNQGKVNKALECYGQSLTISKRLKDLLWIATNLNNIGLVHYGQGNLDSCIRYYKKGLQIFTEIGDQLDISTALSNIGIAYSTQGSIDEALKYFQKSMKISENINNKKGIAVCLNSIGFMYKKQGEISKGLEYYKKSLQTAQEKDA